MLLKQSTLTDFKEIFDLLYENGKWLEEQKIFQWPLAWLESKIDEIKASVAQGDFYEVEIDNRIAAVVELKTSPEEIWGCDEAKALYIHKLAVRRIHKNQGLGRKVLNLIKEDAVRQNLTHLRLDCVEHNLALCKYYESCGFEMTRVVSTSEVDLALYEYRGLNAS